MVEVKARFSWLRNGILLFFVFAIPFVVRAEDWQDDIRRQIERNWNIDPEAAQKSDIKIEIRITLEKDGTVTKVEILNDQPNNVDYRALADSAKRAIILSSPLKLPKGQYWPSLVLRFDPKAVIE